MFPEIHVFSWSSWFDPNVEKMLDLGTTKLKCCETSTTMIVVEAQYISSF